MGGYGGKYTTHTEFTPLSGFNKPVSANKSGKCIGYLNIQVTPDIEPVLLGCFTDFLQALGTDVPTHESVTYILVTSGILQIDLPERVIVPQEITYVIRIRKKQVVFAGTLTVAVDLVQGVKGR